MHREEGIFYYKNDFSPPEKPISSLPARYESAWEAGGGCQANCQAG